MSTEYVDDVPYVRHFVAELSPSRIRLAAALNGVTPPPAEDFDYCEIGCAHGDTLVALAAAHPDARFLGVDLGAAHVAAAKRLAREGGLENVGVLHRDFAALADDEVADLDYLVAHGVLSWVSPDKRRALFELAGKKLKRGGLLFVSYNAMPGWSSVEPLRQLLLFGGVGATTLERARRGLDFARRMEKAGALYFARNPDASAMLDTMEKAGLAYLVHEYLHEHWVPMYFARVAAEASAHDLHFAGVLPLHLNFRDTAISEEVERLLANVDDRVTFESLKDFAVGEFFRRDVYVKGEAERSSDATNAYLDATAWGLRAPPPDERVVRLSQRTIRVEGAPFDALFEALAEGAATVPDLAARAGVPLDEARRAIARMAATDLVVPLRAPTRAGVHGEMFRVPSVYNQAMLRRLSSDAPIVLVSQVAGTGFPISALDALALRVYTEVEPADRERWVDDLVARSVLRILIGDKLLVERADQARAILDAVVQLRAERLPRLVELGILEPI